MSKTIQIQSTGGPEVLQLISRDVDRPGLGQVRLAQTAIGLNYVDVMVRTGLFPVGLPAIPGFEAAGTVEAVGPGVSGFAPGDRVAYFFADGAYAEVSNVPAAALILLPDDIPDETAATFLAKGLTAWMGLHALAKPAPGDTILVLGASGNVGSILSRWATAEGINVIGVAGSSSKLDKVAAGATHALLAGDNDVSGDIRQIAPDGVDVVYDFVGQSTFDLAVAAVRDGGVIATMGAASGSSTPPTEALRRRGVEVRGGGTPQYVRDGTVEIAAAALWDRLRRGVFEDLSVERYAFEDVARAHAAMDSRRLGGLPVLIV